MSASTSRASSRGRESTSSTTETEEIIPRRKRGRPTGGGKHPVHELFNYSEEHKESKCVIEECSHPEVPGKHAGNLMAHVKVYHKNVHKTLLAELEKSGISPTKKSKSLDTLHGVKMSGPALELHCLRLVTEHGLSFRTLDYSAFQDIIQPMLNAMRSTERPTITARAIPAKIPGFAERVRQRIKDEVKGHMISLKVDGCTRQRRHFVGVTIQFGSKGQSTIRTLAVEELFDSATAANLKSLIEIVLKRFAINVKQIVSFTTDSGANYVLAGKLLTDGPGPEPLNAFYDDWIDGTVELSQDDFTLQSIRCAAHTLHLAIEDAVKAAADIQPTIQAARNLAKFLLQETQARQIKNAKPKLPLPKLDVCTRWGSMFDMLASVAFLKNFVKYSLSWSTADKLKYDLSEEEWETVESILADLRPARKAMGQLQREDLTLGEFFVLWTGISLELESRQEHDTSPLARELLKAMKDRAKGVPYRDRARGDRVSPLFHYPGFDAAVFMDPRFMSLLTAEQVQEAKTYLITLSERMEDVRGPTTSLEPEDSDSDSEVVNDVLEQASGDSERPSLISKLLATKNRERLAATTGRGQTAARGGARASKRAALRSLLDEYDRTTAPLAEKDDVFKFWEGKKLICSELHDLAMVVLSIPATQVSVERLFSALKFILRPQRFGLSAEHIDNVTFLHANIDVVRDVLQDLLHRKK